MIYSVFFSKSALSRYTKYSSEHLYNLIELHARSSVSAHYILARPKDILGLQWVWSQMRVE